MANNRMYLRCKQCDEMQLIAKFYPSGGFFAGDGAGWYTNGDKSEKIDEYFQRHMHDYDDKMFGGYQYELVYETPEKQEEVKETPSN